MPHRTLDELIENFSLFDDWEDRYAYLIEIGRALPPMSDDFKNEGNEVKGCVSKVWLTHEKDSQGHFHFMADSNADITRGLVAITLSAYDGKTADEIAGVDIESVFAKMGFNEHLTENRRNGFFAMVEKVKGLSQ